jgi:hypothetical protein
MKGTSTRWNEPAKTPMPHVALIIVLLVGLAPATHQARAQVQWQETKSATRTIALGHGFGTMKGLPPSYTYTYDVPCP